jgi:glycosyltransferase involved in cell wall biosynthesis
MKVLIFNSLYAPFQVGGAERSVQILAETLAGRGHEVTVACTASSAGRDTLDGVDVRYLRIPNIYWMRNSASHASVLKPIWHAIDVDNRLAESQYLDLLTEVSPDLVHTNNLAGLSVAVWRAADRASIPMLHTIRDHYLLCVRSTMFDKGRRCEKQCALCRMASLGKKKQAPRVRAVVGISDHILDVHLAHGFFSTAAITRTIYNSVTRSPEPIAPTPRDPSRVRLGFVGTLAPHKGIELFLESLKSLDSPRVSAHVYGRPCTESYGAYLTSKFSASDVTFHGHQQPDRIYPSLDALVVPSLWDEPFGRIVAEANSYGVPVVASNRGGLPEIVTENVNGFLFDADRTDGLTASLKRLLEDLSWLSRMPDSAQRASLQFTPDQIADQYEDLYHEVLK